MNWSEKLYAQGKIIYRPFTTTTLKYNYILDRLDYQDYDHYFSLNPGGILKRFNYAFTNIINLTQTLSSSTFFQFNLSKFYKQYRHYVYEDFRDQRYTHVALLNQQPQEAPSFKTGGTLNQQFNRSTRSHAIKFDMTTQLNKDHQIKFGMDITQHQLNFEDINLIQEEGFSNPAVTGDPFVPMRIPDANDPNENLSINNK